MALLSGWVYRESGVVSGISNRRWGSLFSHSFVTFRKEASREPSKVWPLHGHCKLSSVERKEVMIRNRHTSTIWALAAGHYEKKQLVSWQRGIGGPSPCRAWIKMQRLVSSSPPCTSDIWGQQQTICTLFADTRRSCWRARC